MDKAHARQGWNADDLDRMMVAYLRTALWSTTGDDGEPLNVHHGAEDISAATVEELRAEVLDFYRANRRDLCAWTDPGDAGHLFWLNRNGHGAGFWDRVYAGAADTAEYRRRYGMTRAAARSRVRFNAAMERLAAAAKVYGSVDLYVGDDGRVHA